MLDPVAQRDYEALRHGVGYCDWNRTTRIEITGDDRCKFLNSYCTNDLKALQPGQGCETFVPNGQGKVLGFLAVFCDTDRWIIETAPDQASTLLNHFDRYVLRSKVAFRELPSEVPRRLLAGRGVEALLSQGTSQELPSTLNSHRRVVWHGWPLWVARIQYLGPQTWLLAMESSAPEAVDETLLGRGARRCGERAIESLRLESGTPVYGVDISTENLPQELAIDARTISFNKGCYLGQETIARIDAMGHVNWLWAGFQFSEATLPAIGTEMKRNDKVVGRVTSAAWSPLLNAPLAVGFVRRGHHSIGTSFATSFGSAEIVTLPVVPRDGV